MTEKKPSETGRNEKEASKSSNNIEEDLCSNKDINGEKTDTKNVEWKHITDYAPKKGAYTKTKNMVSGAYTVLTKWTKDTLLDTKQKISSEGISKLHEKTTESLNKIKQGAKTGWMRDLQNKILANKNALKYTATAGITAVLVILMVWLNIRPVVVVCIDKKPVAIVPDKKSFEGILGNLQGRWKNVYKKDIKVKGALSYKFKLLPSRLIDTPRQVAEAVEAHTDSLIKAKAITVNGEAKAVIKDTGSANVVLETIKKKFTPKSDKNVQFVEDVKVADIYVLPQMIQSEQSAAAALLANVDAIKEYIVKQGDTLWNIADNNNISVEKLAALNPEVSDSLKPGQVIRLAVPKSIVNVKTIEYAEIKEDTPFETKFQSDSSRTKGERKVIQAGILGKKLYKVEIIKQNGVEVSRNILEEKVVQQPKTEIVAVGTKASAAKSATGAFRVPAFGSVTSRFGFRWGRVHEGVDIAGRTGEPIYAADGGKVIFAGVESGYGNLVKIDHGNGLVTYYGHCSKLLVKVGQSVSKGDKIALVGSTGHSTGPHVHFEVRKNGSPVDPTKYLK